MMGEGGGGAGHEVPAGGEGDYRLAVDELLSRLDAAFADVDPDVAESDYAQGTLVITFGGKYKLILSPQAPTRQIWVAFRDRAWHFAQGSATGRWLDDRGQGVELLELIASLAREHAGVEIKL